MDENEEDLERLIASLKQDYIMRAKAVAYMIQNHPERESDRGELKKMAELL